MTRKETEIFLNDCPRLFSNFLNDHDFCLPYGSGWFDILHKSCLELEVLNKDGTYVIFEEADYIINEIDKKHNRSGIIKFCTKIIKPDFYSSFHTRIERLASGILNKLVDKSLVTCEICGIESNEVNCVLEEKETKCICAKCYNIIKGKTNEQCDN